VATAWHSMSSGYGTRSGGASGTSGTRLVPLKGRRGPIRCGRRSSQTFRSDDRAPPELLPPATRTSPTRHPNFSHPRTARRAMRDRVDARAQRRARSTRAVGPARVFFDETSRRDEPSRARSRTFVTAASDVFRQCL
jgi:hypothetical protein